MLVKFPERVRRPLSDPMRVVAPELLMLPVHVLSPEILRSAPVLLAPPPSIVSASPVMVMLP